MKASKSENSTKKEETVQQNPETEDRVVSEVPGIDSSQVIPLQPKWYNAWFSRPRKKRPYSDYVKMKKWARD